MAPNTLAAMGLLDLRDLLSFPANGANASETIINGVHFNLTALNHWNYTYYSNNTISNNSKCYIIKDQFKPIFMSNGSWVNATNCYVPIYGIKARGATSIAFAALFAATLVFTLLNLKKHGQIFLREDKRFRAVGRRWQWYWALFVAACAIISTITGIDVDRDYLQDLAIILQGFFYSLMLPGTLAMVWESVRHWGSWQERQICDRDPYLLRQDDKRSQAEFYMPLVFYLFAWLNFFMTIPRSWTNIKKQHDVWQQDTIAEPSATDARFKAASILAVCAYIVICYSLSHSLYYYKPRATGFFRKIDNFCHHCPTKLFLLIVILAIRLGYAIASAWVWDISILKYDVNPGWPFGLGYGTVLLLIVILEIWGFIEKNEDKVLITQRRERGREIDQELGITKKPTWWSKIHGDSHLTADERLRALTHEVGGGRPTAQRISANVELGNMNIERTEASAGGLRERSRSRPPQDPFRDESPESTPDTLRPTPARTETDNVSTMTDRTLTNVQPQRIRSMLDI